MPDNGTLLNIAAVPPPAVAGEVQKLSTRAQHLGGLFAVDGRDRHPHLTLYMARFPAGLEWELAEQLAELTLRLGPVVAEHCGYFVTQGNYYEASYARTQALIALHFTVMSAFAPTRLSPGRPRREEYFGSYSPEQQSNAEEYGYDLAGQLYRPHVTVSRFSSEPTGGLPRSGRSLSFCIESLTLFRVDEFGSAVELIVTEPLPLRLSEFGRGRVR